MTRISRRSLARWAADRLAEGEPVPQIARQLAATLCQFKMTEQAGFLIDDIAWELERRGRLAVAKVTSASPLSKQLADTLTAHLKKVAGTDDVVIEPRIDKSVVGGVRVETAGFVWDQTVSRQLDELREAF